MKTDKIIICWGTLMYDELYYPLEDEEELEDFDILEWIGYRKLTEDEEDKFHSKYQNKWWLLKECNNIKWTEEDGENIPIKTDVNIIFFTENTDQLVRLKKEVRNKINEVLDK